MRTTIVIPCYNEERRLDCDAYVRFAREGHDVQLLFVNDGSRDGTLRVLETLRQREPATFSVLDLPRNGGKAEAVRQGVLAALDTGTDCVGFWDADLATPLSAIVDFRDTLRRRPQTDLVIGSRLRLLGHDIQRTRARWLLGRTFANVASRALGVPLQDTQCGAKLFRATATTRVLFAAPFLSQWIFDVELFARWVQLSGDRRAVARSIFEYPLENWCDVPGSNLRPKHFAIAFTDLWRIYFRCLSPFATPLAAAPTLLPLPNSSPTDHAHEVAQPRRRAG